MALCYFCCAGRSSSSVSLLKAGLFRVPTTGQVFWSSLLVSCWPGYGGLSQFPGGVCGPTNGSKILLPLKRERFAWALHGLTVISSHAPRSSPVHMRVVNGNLTRPRENDAANSNDSLPMSHDLALNPLFQGPLPSRACRLTPAFVFRLPPELKRHGAKRSLNHPASPPCKLYRNRSCNRLLRPCQNSQVSGLSR